MQLPIYPDQSVFAVETDIATTQFACDLNVCKGACCTMPGGLGAPILKEEIEIIESVFPLVKHRLPEIALDTIAEKGLWQRNIDGTYTITTVGNAECVLVHWDGDIAKCAIQTAYYAGEVQDYPKPISCHLFPIRIYPDKGDDEYYMCYVEADECAGGRKHGAETKTNLLDYLKTPLSRALGEGRYEALKERLMEG